MCPKKGTKNEKDLIHKCVCVTQNLYDIATDAQTYRCT